jgi:hypothetical protein
LGIVKLVNEALVMTDPTNSTSNYPSDYDAEADDCRRQTSAITPNPTLEIEAENFLSKFSWGDPISVNYTELFLNIQGVEIPLMLQFRD